MKRAMEVMKDPKADARVEAATSRKERRQELVIEGHRAAGKEATAKDTSLTSSTELFHYLRARKSTTAASGSVSFKLSGKSVTALWHADKGEVHFKAGASTRVAKLSGDGSLSSKAVEGVLGEL